MNARATRRAIGATALSVSLLAFPALAADHDLDLASRATGGGAADDGSTLPRLSTDGNRVSFVSGADNLASDDNSSAENAFVRDLAQGTTTFVNRGDGVAGTAPSAGAFATAISADGNRIAFDGPATLDDPMAVAFTNIFLRDVAAGTTTLVSRATGAAGARGDSSSFQPSISADARVIAFESVADNLATDDDKARSDIFVRDVVAGTTELVSRRSGPGGDGGDADSNSPAVSGDGRMVVFLSSASNLSDADADGNRDVFVRDRVTDLTVLVSRASGANGVGSDGDSGTASISADGRHVFFYSAADNLSTEDDDSVSDVFVRDLVTNTTTLVSRASGTGGAGGDGASAWGGLSADGRLAVFSSRAKNLSTEDDDVALDIFVRDLAAATTTLVSRSSGATGAPGDADSSIPVISADGRRVAFQSEANNLSADDINTVTNVFVRTLPPPVALPGPGAATSPPPAPTTTAKPTARCAGLRATIVGSVRRDVIRGTARRDVIAALGGNDVVRGLGGSDLICLGPGDDRGLGGAGADRILGGPGRDTLLGGPGLDRLLGQAGRDRARGGLGRDVCSVEARAAC